MPDANVWEDFAALPPQAQQQVADFVAFLRQRYPQVTLDTQPQSGELTEKPFIGMWADRADMEDSTQWVRNLRGQEWPR